MSVKLTLNGVLISPNNRSALVDGRVYRVGDRIDGIEVLSIDRDGIRVMQGSRPYAVPIGGTAVLASSRSHPGATSDPGRLVTYGDSLSGIASDYAGNGVSLEQAMLAVYDANPSAFGGNMNRLYAGARLRIPTSPAMRNYGHEAAVATIADHSKRWRADRVRARRLAARQPGPTVGVPPATPPAAEYGPVRAGETLSAIAVRLARDDVSMQQMMAALFEANPDAFGDSMDLLHEGAVLSIPDLSGTEPGDSLAALVVGFQPRCCMPPPIVGQLDAIYRTGSADRNDGAFRRTLQRAGYAAHEQPFAGSSIP